MSAIDDRVYQLFHAARRLPATQHAAFLAEQCIDEPEVQQRVRDLLGSVTAGERLFEGTVNPFAGPLSVAEGRFAHFDLHECLGRGGMGTVYRATDLDNRRTVVLKLLRPEVALSGKALARFEEERRILGQLNHPAIATLFHSGVFAEIPWISMEYVEGEHLDVYCDRLAVLDRLRIFRQVVEAVQAAHRKRIIHRDLKPSNILVRADEQVKLLDFGIAKQLDTREVEATVPDMQRLTPLYASPEQVGGETSDTASDVYSLGVVLYRLIAGKTPYRATDVLGVLQAIRQETPPPPSRVAAEGKGLSRRQWSDLDALCAKAMRKNPDERYAGASDLLRDLDAFLAHQPLAARTADPLWHRVLRFGRRHRAAMITAGNVVALLLVVGGLFTYQLAKERDRAAEAAQLAERAQSFTEALFLGDKNAGMPAAPLRPLVNRAAAIVAQLDEQPKLQSRLFLTMATAHQALGQYDRALADLAQSVALARAVHGPGSAPAIRSQAELARFLVAQSRTAEGQAVAVETLRHAQRLAGADRSAYGTALIAMAKVHRARGRSDRSAELAQEAAAVFGSLKNHERQRADALNTLAIAQHNLGKYEAALATNREVLRIHRETFGRDHVLAADDLLNIGTIHLLKGEFEPAQASFGEALRINRAWYGDEHPEVGAVYLKLSTTYRHQEQPGKAEPLAQSALRLFQAAYPEAHQRTANALNEMALVHALLGRNRAAEDALRHSYAIYCALYGPVHSGPVVILTNLGDLHLKAKRLDRAEALYRQSLRPWTHDLRHPEAAGIRLRLGEVLRQRGANQEAKEELTAAYEVFAQAAGPESPNAKVALRRLGQIEK